MTKYEFIICVFLSLLGTQAKDVRNKFWCGTTMNPLEKARAIRSATEMFFDCKDEIIKQNVKPSVIRELDRLCASWRLCYVIGPEIKNVSRSFIDGVIDCMQKIGHAWITINPAAPKMYNTDIDGIGESFRRCARRYFPKNVNYILEATKWMKDFVKTAPLISFSIISLFHNKSK